VALVTSVSFLFIVAWCLQDYTAGYRTHSASSIQYLYICITLTIVLNQAHGPDKTSSK
jgi:hypothetical protein